MRLPGDVDGCQAAARELHRAARQLDALRDRLEGLSRDEWRGRAAQAWAGVRDERVEAVRAQSVLLSAAASAVERYAATLEQLQARADRLSAQAAGSGLQLGDGGGIPAVAEPAGELDPLLLRERARRQEARREVMAAAAVLLAELRDAQDRLVGELAGRTYRPSRRTAAEPGVLAWLAPTAGDLPSLALSGAGMLAEVRPQLPAVLRSARGMGAAGFGVGVVTDLVQGRDLDDALTKGVVVLGVATGAAAVAPAAVPVLAVGAGAGAVGYLAGKAFDRFGYRLPWVEHRRPGRETTPRPAPPRPRPQPGPAPSPRHAVHRRP